jgi:hypothetical protein
LSLEEIFLSPTPDHTAAPAAAADAEAPASPGDAANA